MSRGFLAFLLALVIAALLVDPVAAAPASGTGTLTARTSVENSVVSLLNQARREHGLRPLRVSKALGRAAVGHARAMAQLGFFAHESADGTPAGERIRRYYRGSLVGETLLWRSPDVSADEAVRMWMASSEHRRILLGGGFGDIGLAAIHASGAPAAFRGLDVTIVVADLGSR